jgi:hypothetical protein
MLIQDDVLQMQVRTGQRPGRALTDRVRGTGATVTPNRSRASSVIPRREIRYAAVNATIAACNRVPNGDPATAAGSWALVRARQQRQRN